jgi:glutathione synthase/RimK-type ligase-like ATP-grasp enzyme
MPSLLFFASLDRTPHGVFKYNHPAERQFRQAYLELEKKLKKNGFSVYFTDIKNLSKDGTIAEAYVLRDTEADALEFELAPAPVSPDIIVNRRKDELYDHPAYDILAATSIVVNDKQVASLGSKAMSHSKLSAFLPETVAIDGSQDDRIEIVRRTLGQFGTIVIKPVRESGGSGIVVTGDESEALDAIADGRQYILQKFIETNGGVKGLASGRHDIRLYIISGSVIAGSVRRPKDGELLSNTALGGSITFLTMNELPQDLLDLAKTIISQTQLPAASFISLDFFYGDGKWYLIEVNDQPGLPASYQHEQVATDIHNALVTMYTEAINHD